MYSLKSTATKTEMNWARSIVSSMEIRAPVHSGGGRISASPVHASTSRTSTESFANGHTSCGISQGPYDSISTMRRRITHE